jgi:hypothetical protein
MSDNVGFAGIQHARALVRRRAELAAVSGNT